MLYTALCVTLLAVSPPDARDWPTYNYDVRGTRHNGGESTLRPDNVGDLVEKWRFPAKDSGERIGIIRATPVVVNGYVYFGTTTDPAFYKLAPDGKLAWSYRNRDERGKTVGGSIYGSALVTGESVHFVDVNGYVYALDRKTGKERWKVNTRDESFPAAHPTNISFASPIAADGLIIVAGGSGEQAIPAFMPGYPCCTGRGYVVAMEPESGKVVWTYLVGETPEKLDPPITIKDAWGEHVFRYGPSTSSVWSTPSHDSESATVFFGTDTNNSPRQPTEDDPRLHTERSCAVIAVDSRTGREKWVTQLSAGDVWHLAMRGYDPERGKYLDLSIGDTPKAYSIADGGRTRRVVGVGSKDGAFYVLDAATGEVINHTPVYSEPPSHPPDPPPDPRTIALPSPAGGIQTGCAVDGNAVYTNALDQIRSGTPERPSIFEDHPPTGGRVVSLSLDARSEKWRHERPTFTVTHRLDSSKTFHDVGDPVASGVAVAGGVVYFTGVISKNLVALSARDGQVLKVLDVGPVWSGPSVSRGRVYVGTGMYGIIDDEVIRRFVSPFFGTQDHGILYSFGLPGEDEVDRLGAGDE
ncbi:MAG: outer membrane protein assembly factor BamB family protein [Planctomycetota bacterium]|jgi:outer membrane protein assembly factor BamB